MGKFTAYKLALKQLPAGHSQFRWTLGKQFFADMENEDIHDADVEATLDVDYSNGIYKLHFTFAGELTLLCDRCLDALQWPVDCAYDIDVRYGDSYDDSSDKVLVIPESDAFLNVAYMMYDTVALAIPLRHVHPHGKCNRAMTNTLNSHRATRADDPDAELEQELIDEIDDADDAAADNNGASPAED